MLCVMPVFYTQIILPGYPVMPAFYTRGEGARICRATQISGKYRKWAFPAFISEIGLFSTSGSDRKRKTEIITVHISEIILS